MMKTSLRLYDVGTARADRVAGDGIWRRLSRAMSSALQTVLSWPAIAYRARRDMEQIGRMSERELSDIGLIRQDLYDLHGVPLGRDPTLMLSQRVHQRKRARRDRLNSRPDVAPWGL